MRSASPRTAFSRSEGLYKMEGTLTLFGIPFVRKGDVVRLTDKDRPERDGKRFRVDAVTYGFGTGGYRQEVTLGKRIGRGE